MTDLAAALDLVKSIADAATDARSGWQHLLRALADHCAPDTVSQLARIDFESDVAAVHQQLAAILQQDPPSADIDALWFGLFDGFAEDENGGEAECIGFYVAGIRGFDADDEDAVCSPAWWPEERYLESAALDAIKRAELEARRMEADDEEAYLAYAGQLGTALLVARFSAAGLAGMRQLVVGFDSGDFVAVGA